MKLRGKLLVFAGMLAGLQAVAWGLIDPTFTPIDLVEQSEEVLVLDFQDPNEEGTGIAAVREVLKGEHEGQTVKVEFLAMGEALAASSRAVMGWIASGQRLAMLFIGSFERDGGGGERIAYLHVAGQWLLLSEYEGDWDMDKVDPRLLGCWAGSTDMLLRCVQYVQSNENAEVPVRAHAAWQPEVRFGQLEGEICGVEPVNVTGAKGKTDLFVTSTQGDRLFRFDGGEMADVTDRHKLTSRSRVCTWGEFTGDGTLDLLSWDGEALSLHAQKADGTFEAKALGGGEGVLEGDCLSLSTFGAGGGTKVVAAVDGPPVILTIEGDGSIGTEPMAGADYAGKDLGTPSVCLVADFDGDNKVDVLQLFAVGSLFYAGTGDGKFAAPVTSRVATGGRRHGACLGDYDADGLLDVFVGGERRHRLFHSLGGGRFVDLLHRSGEIEYIPKPGAIRVQTGDVNNDGRQDVLVVYGAQLSPHLFFNRGFRSFGHARELDLQMEGRLPEASRGQQGGCLGDFNGDGALDMVLALMNGELWILLREVEYESAMAATADLSPTSPWPGPVNVAACAGEPPRELGTCVVRQGGAPALWGVPESEAGNVTVRWRTPGGTAQSRIVEVVPGDEPKHVVVGAPAAE